MSNGFSNVRAQSPMDDPNRMGGTVGDTGEQDAPKHELDGQKKQDLLSKMREWYEQEWRRQAANRYQMALDEDYYDSMQWTEEDAQALIERGQAPLVFNEIKPTIDWVIGTERRTRIDYKVLSRRGEKEATSDAENKTQLLKYLSDVNKSPYQRSMAFENAIKAGVGWLETGIRGDRTDELAYTRNESWRNIVYDSNSIEMDASDMRYIFRIRWTDTDIAEAYFPERAEVIRDSTKAGNAIVNEEEDFYFMGARVTAAGSDYSASAVGKYHQYDSAASATNNRDRVKLVECWYKVPVLIRKFSNGYHDGEVFDSQNPEHITALSGGYSLYDKLELEVRCAIFCDNGLLFDGKSPYKHQKLPFVPIWCYRRKRDNAPYGMIRNLRDPQDDLNKRASKALFILSTNRVIADEGAVDDWDELRREVSRPDSIIIKKQGKMLEISRDIQLAEEHLSLMDRDVQHIRNVGGVTAENLGRQTNADSGKAIQARQEQGGVVTTAPFDNMHFAMQIVGEMELSNVEQFYSDEKVVRILGERGGAKYVELNKQQADGSVLNDITKFQSDFVISEQSYRSTLRQAMYESMFDIVGKLAQFNPQASLNLLDLVVEMADIPNKDELVQRIRQMNGMKDPDEEIPPEQQAQLDQEAKVQADQQAQLQQQVTQLELGQKQAAIAESQARAEKMQADAQKVIAELQGVGAANDVQAKFQTQIQGIQQQAQDRVDNLVNQVAQLQVELKNRSLEIEKRHEAELAKAASSKEATIQAEHIKADAAKEVEAAKSETLRDIAEIQAKSDSALDSLNKQMDGVVKSMTDQIKELSNQIKENAKVEKKEVKEVAPQPAPVINVTVEGGKATQKKINIKKDKDGNIIGAEVEETQVKDEE